MTPNAAKPRVAGATEVTRTSRGHAHGGLASPGIGRPPGSDSLTGRSQGTNLLGLEPPSDDLVSFALLFLPPCGVRLRSTRSLITRLRTLCGTRATQVNGSARNPYVLQRIFPVVPSAAALIHSPTGTSSPGHQQGPFVDTAKGRAILVVTRNVAVVGAVYRSGLIQGVSGPTALACL
jgi:hypothetical protein